MNFLELNNKKNEALKIMQEQILKLIDFGDNSIITTLNYRINRDKHYFIFSLTYIDGGYSDWGTYDVINKYSIVYDIEDDCFCLEFDKSREGFHSDNKDILKLHEQLCSKKEEMIKIINQDF